MDFHKVTDSTINKIRYTYCIRSKIATKMLVFNRLQIHNTKVLVTTLSNSPYSPFINKINISNLTFYTHPYDYF